VIYTKSLPPIPAVIWSGLMNFLGVLVGGTLCNDTGFVMEAERDETSEEAGNPDIPRTKALSKRVRPTSEVRSHAPNSSGFHALNRGNKAALSLA
jgi:hypothetical protein